MIQEQGLLCDNCGGVHQLTEFVLVDIRGYKIGSKNLCLGCRNAAIQAEKKETVIAYEETF